jgi:hypothetical protein
MSFLGFKKLFVFGFAKIRLLCHIPRFFMEKINVNVFRFTENPAKRLYMSGIVCIFAPKRQRRYAKTKRDDAVAVAYGHDVCVGAQPGVRCGCDYTSGGGEP